jgi:predicted Zn-dependent peptidase
MSASSLPRGCAPARRAGLALELALVPAFALSVALATGALAASTTHVTKAGLKAQPAGAKAPKAMRTGLESLEAEVKDFTLPNGLKFIVVERHEAPVFSFNTIVNSGSANDAVGTTGLAHMMEHMAFKGTERVGTKDWAAEAPLLAGEEQAWNAYLAERRKGARADTTKLATLRQGLKDAQEAARQPIDPNGFTRTIEQNGGQNVNAFTSNDITSYFYSMPSNRLELWSLLEGGRLAHPVFREFYKERDVVFEERRMRVESSPVGRLVDEFIHAAFTAHPYGFGGIGFPSDLTSFSRTQGEEFFRRNYVAKNMVVSIVGDVTAADVKAYGAKYWSDISDAPAPQPLDTVEPEQRAERRVILEDKAQPFLLIGWHCPAATDPSYPAFEALSSLLAGGDFARLTKLLVKEKKVAVNVIASPGFPGQKYPNEFVIFVVPAAGQDPLALERMVDDALDDITTKHPFTQDELNGFKVRSRAERISAVRSNATLASSLAEAQTFYGDWHEFFREQERVQALTVDDVIGAMKRTLVRSNRTVGVIVAPKTDTAATEGGR